MDPTRRWLQECQILQLCHFITSTEWKQKPQKVNCRRVHALNSCPLFNSSRTQKIISLSSCEAELHAIIPSASDGIYIHAVLDFALGTKVVHYIFTDTPGARQLVMKRGVGKVRHLDGKLLCIQNSTDRW